MKNKIATKQVGKNVLISIFVQVVSLAVSFLMNLIVPKFISELEYAHWQTYMLYVGYVGVLHFGLLDGIVLRYSQYDYDELDKPRIRSQFQLLLAADGILALLVIAATVAFSEGGRRFIFIFVACGIVTKNIYTYTSYTFQITNRISKYAIQVISMRIFYGIMITVFLFLKVEHFYWFCIADLSGDLFGVVVGYFYNKDLYFGKSLTFKDSITELSENISSGILLLIANWSSMLLIGSAKMIIQWHWNELTFGKVSFAFSISNLFLTFVNAISVVLFPSLKRMEQDKLSQLYMSIRNAISPILFFAMLFYFPGCLVLDMWLPKYHESLIYLGILLPIIIYTSKVSLLTNNYLKAYRKEKLMLIVNVISVVAAICCFVFCAYLLDNLTALLVMTVLVIMMRSILSEIVVMKIIHIKMVKDFIIESIMTILFIFSAKGFDLWIGFCVYLVSLIIYLWINKENLKSYFSKFKFRRKTK